MLQLGFPFGGLRHEEVVVLGLALLAVGPVGVADVVGPVQESPCGLDHGSGLTVATARPRWWWSHRVSLRGGWEEAVGVEVVVEFFGCVAE